MFITGLATSWVGTPSQTGHVQDACLNNEFAESNLYLLTGRNDGEILLSDSPLTQEHLLEQTRAPSDLTPFEAEQWIPGALSDMRESWLSQMKMEVDIVNFIVDTGDLIWPLAIAVSGDIRFMRELRWPPE